MGKLLTLKIEIAKVIKLIHHNDDNDVDEYLNKRLARLKYQYDNYGVGEIFKVLTPKGVVYFTNMEKTEIEELLDGKYKTYPYVIEEIKAGLII